MLSEAIQGGDGAADARRLILEQRRQGAFLAAFGAPPGFFDMK